ncbi:acyltransferase [Polynucleobacter sp. AP-Feld-500C-C5]|uniref:acyltransferase n=1 Tax=Polynucleobacter sp. AP-Feld-500C-C5 TaxID=2576924 RepID=UPI001C0BB050|nr:acyltransferase [Polynucleobacter sp. AP-Feld-500C-C5]MBU3632885.1 N-acetyltransferase [Polynucleobacter sp. AP-Feld-500C-C5]
MILTNSLFFFRKKPVNKNSGIKNVKFGKNLVVINPSNLYDCNLGDNVFVGPFVEIQKDVTIGDGTKIQSHAFICEMVTIGKNCFISHGVMFVNDLFADGGPAGGDRLKWKATILGDRVSVGTNSTILPVKICSDVVIGAGSVVTKDILNPGIYLGNPAKYIRAVND